MTQDKGRGMFATKLLKRGDLLIVETAVAEAPKITVINFCLKSQINDAP